MIKDEHFNRRSKGCKHKRGNNSTIKLKKKYSTEWVVKATQHNSELSICLLNFQILKGVITPGIG